MDMDSLFAKKPLTLSSQAAGASAVLLLAAGFFLGVGVDKYLAYRQGAIGNSGAPEGVDMAPVWKAWAVIDEKFVPAAVSTTTPTATTTAEINQERVWGMIGGLAASLNDPYTFFMPPQQAQAFSDDMAGSFSGVGMEIAVKDQVLTVVSPLKGSPSEKAGIRAGDKILKINDSDTKGLDVTAAVQKIRGPKGTTVKLTVSRESWDEPRDIKVVRDVITVPIITTTKRDDGVFVIAVATFTANSPDLFRDALREFVKSGSNKLVLDLRGNPGGYLDAAVSMASWFLPSGKVIVTEDYDGHADTIVHRSLGYNVFNKNLRMVILVDKGSASASEILADALRFYGVGQMVGTKTFGKGSVQELVPITPDTALKVTVARWLGPDGLQIPHEGLSPDVTATTSEEMIKAGKDPQMDAAVDTLIN